MTYNKESEGGRVCFLNQPHSLLKLLIARVAAWNWNTLYKGKKNLYATQYLLLMELNMNHISSIDFDRVSSKYAFEDDFKFMYKQFNLFVIQFGRHGGIYLIWWKFPYSKARITLKIDCVCFCRERGWPLPLSIERWLKWTC